MSNAPRAPRRARAVVVPLVATQSGRENQDRRGLPLSQERESVAAAHEALRDEHERLRALVGRLRARPGREDLAALLHELPGRLAEHFRLEERPGGLYDTLGVSIPDARGQVAQLIDDHFRLVSVARDLAETALAPDVPTRALQEEALRVADYLGDHERREQELVRTFFSRS